MCGSSNRVAVGLALLCVCAARGQFIPDLPVPPLGDLLPVPTLGDLRREQPPLTTSIEDAVYDIPWLDTVEPAFSVPANGLERDGEGAFLVPVGHWAFDLEGFCLKPGTGRPGGGSAYLYAPLEGPMAPIVAKLLTLGAEDRSITQEAMQELLWAIICRANWAEVPEEARRVAERLLSRSEQRRIRSGSTGVVPPELQERVFGELPAELRSVFEAENTLRRLFSEGVGCPDLVGAAALDLEPPAPEALANLAPWGRWSRHPNGLYLRFEPADYTRCVIHVIHPQGVVFERDRLGRIVGLRNPGGCHIVAHYADEGGYQVPRWPELTAYRFASLRAYSPAGNVVWEQADTGWTFVQRPLGADRVGRSGGLRFVAGGPAGDGFLEELEGFYERIKEWQELKGKVDELNERWEKQLGRQPTPEELCNFYNVKHFNEGFDAAVRGGQTEKTEWLVENLKLGVDAYIQAGNILMDPELLSKPPETNNNTPPTPLRIELTVGTPANTDSQRQGFWALWFGG